jgi:flagellar biosynthesis/type III secretory pathway M-ring protein FliF/YscJ
VSESGKGSLIGANTASGLGTMGAALLAFAAVIAVIVATVAVVKHFKKEAEEYEKAAQRSAKQAKEAQEAAASVRQEYDNLKSTLDGLNEKQTKIDEMIAGTREWKEAVAEVNGEI